MGVEPDGVFSAAKKAAHKAYVEMRDQVAAETGAPFVGMWVAAFAGAIVFVGSVLKISLTSTFLGASIPLAEAVLNLIGDVRREGFPAMSKLSAEVLNEFLGTNLSSDNIPDGSGQRGNIKQVQAIGAQLHSVLIDELAPEGLVTPESGEKAARAFTGFNIRFTIANAFIDMLGEFFSDGHLDSVRELGAGVAQNLALGRMHRQALMPLVRNLIAEPYDQSLRKRYRPDRLSDIQYVRAFHRGAIDEATLRDHLAVKGFKDHDIDQLIIEHTAHLQEAELQRMVRFGVLTQEEAIAELVAQGIPRHTAERHLVGNSLQRADSIVNQYVNVLEAKYRDGYISLGEFNKGLDFAPLTEVEKEWERNLLGLQLETARIGLTWAEVRKAYMDGICDLDYVDRWQQSQGYSDEDQLVLTLQLLLDAKRHLEAAEEKKNRKERAAQRQADADKKKADLAAARLARIGANLPPPPSPTAPLTT